MFGFRSPYRVKVVRGYAEAAALADKGWEITNKIRHTLTDPKGTSLMTEETIMMRRPRRWVGRRK